MSVDHSLFQDCYPELPAWTCPTCGKGHLLMDGETFNVVETGPSKKARDHEAWDPEWMEERFSGVLECNFDKCNERVAIIGDVLTEEIYSEGGSYRSIYYPTAFNPAPLPIHIPDETPGDVNQALRLAAGLFWQSREAAGNQIRTAVEYLMDDRRVKKWKNSKAAKNSKNRLTLHGRIELFKEKDPVTADYLLAIKWLGNSGSHSSGLTRTDVLEAFEMMDVVLNKLYNTRLEVIAKKVKEVNRRKGPTGK